MKKALAIVDFYPTSRGGHFHSWFDKIIRCSIQHVDFIGVYALGESSMPLNLISESSFENNQSDVAFFELGQIFHSLKVHSNASKMNLIASHLSNFSGCDNVAIFVMWSFDLLDSLEKPNTAWSGIGVLSALGRNIMTDSFQHEARLLDLVESNVFCKNLLLWDSYVVNLQVSKKTLFLPDIENVEFSKPLFNLDKPKIGLVGQLWGYRGVELLIKLLNRNPSISGLLSGVLKENSLSNKAVEYINSKSQALELNNKYFLSDSDLNYEISKLDALVIDGEKYPPPSGIALRAMFLGRCVISSRGSSWINDVISEYQCGLIIDPDDYEKVHELILTFYANGGSMRAIEAAGSLMNEETFNHCIKTAIDNLFV